VRRGIVELKDEELTGGLTYRFAIIAVTEPDSVINKTLSETADFASIAPPGELDETCVVSVSAYSHYYVLRLLQNRKYATYRISVRGGSNHDHR